MKSIEPVRSDQGLAITYVASTQELGELELKIQTSIQADLNAAEQEARKTIEAIADGLRVAAESSPLREKIQAPRQTNFSGADLVITSSPYVLCQVLGVVVRQ